MSLKTKAVIAVALLSLLDIIIPLPILGTVLLYCILQKPAWFSSVVGELYRTK
jgi:putative effector of murein hydrolase LrgA (UPF0299 family)